MRVLQLIDSLRPGGAEKMAVNIANALLSHVEGSFLCCTRQEGLLKAEVKPEVGYLFLNKKSRLDLKAILGLRQYIKKNNIDIVHAHSTSFFLAGILKLTGSKFKLIWHDHYGECETLEEREFKVLKNFSRFFAGIISVNTALKEWAVLNLNCNNVTEIKNFIPEPDSAVAAKIFLKGSKDDFKIICVANLRPQKDHFNLLEAFGLLETNTEVSLHLIGENPDTRYSGSVLECIKNHQLKNKIFYYGTQKEVISLIKQADLGVLCSRSEGLPLVLLEYGMAGLPVICTNVGQCSDLIGKNGLLIEKQNPKLLAEAILNYLSGKEKMQLDARKFQESLKVKYSENEVINKLLNFY